MKKILLFIFITSLLFGDSLEKRIPTLNISEQKEMLNFLHNKIAENDFSNVFELGLVYEDGLVDSSGNKNSNMEKAKEYFILAFEKGDYRSIFKLIPLLIEVNQYERAFKTLQIAINKTKRRSLQISSISTQATLVLDYFSNDQEKFAKVLINMSNVTKQELDNIPTLKFLKANYLNVVGDKKEAEILLNEACFSKKAPKKLKNICFNKSNFYMAKDDVKKSIDDCVTCSLFEQ